MRPKQTLAVRQLAERVAAGKGLSEMQEEPIRDFGTEYGPE